MGCYKVLDFRLDIVFLYSFHKHLFYLYTVIGTKMKINEKSVRFWCLTSRFFQANRQRDRNMLFFYKISPLMLFLSLYIIYLEWNAQILCAPFSLILSITYQETIYFHHPRKFPCARSWSTHTPFLSNNWSDFYHHSLVFPVSKFHKVESYSMYFFVLGFFHSAYIVILTHTVTLISSSFVFDWLVC